MSGPTTGFFTRQDVMAKPSAKKADDGVALARTLGLRGVQSMNPAARTPVMPARGASNPLFYVLGSAPSRDDDSSGEPFSGKLADALDRHFPRKFDDRIRWGYVVRTLPKKDEPITEFQVECFRPSFTGDVEKSKPAVIVGIGSIPFYVVTGLKRSTSPIVFRGRWFPVQVGGHRCWFYALADPLWTPSMGNTSEARIYDDDWQDMFRRDCKRLFSEYQSRPVADYPNKQELLQDAELIDGCGEKGIRSILSFLKDDTFAALDFETRGLRPYPKQNKILSLAIARKGATIAFPWSHHESRWTADQFCTLKNALRSYFSRGKAKAAHNTGFELEWLFYHFGKDLARRCPWHDTMAQAFILDERVGGHSLDFVGAQRLGVRLKSFSPVDRMNLDDFPLGEVLPYNAMDSEFERRLYYIQRDEIARENLGEAYNDAIRRIPTLVLAQLEGLIVDQKEMKVLNGELHHQIEGATEKLYADPAVIAYEKRFGKFNPSSNDNIGVLLANVKRLPLAQGASGKYQTGKGVLAEFEGDETIPLLQELREKEKLLGTYVERLDMSSPDSLVYPDGRLHTIFNSTITSTGRLSSEGPNMQNFPKRKNAYVRRGIVSGKGYYFLANDYGQIEARNLANFSLDKKVMAMFSDDFDVHAIWAEKIIKAHEYIFKKIAKGDFKKFRSWIKNQVVFPLFYGSSWQSVARALEAPESVVRPLYDEFWVEFAGVKKWQYKMVAFYKEHGYIECANGRRRNGPLNRSQIINDPIQGSTSDLVVDAMNRLSELAQERDEPWLQPVLNVHDDLMFRVPKEKVEDAAEIIITNMIHVPFSWVKVPITIKSSIGTNWFEMEEFGTFDSRHF
jgi:DNA polymerase I-like protein with 3'-5' exonuclease and polymerase domains/uracil-DNA glycosylase